MFAQLDLRASEALVLTLQMGNHKDSEQERANTTVVSLVQLPRLQETL